MLQSGEPTPAARGDVREAAVAGVAVERVRTDVRDVQIDPAVVVVVAGARAHAVVAMPDAGLRGHVVERAVAAVAEQTVPRLSRDRRIGQRTAVDQEDVDPAVVVVVEEQPAGPHGFDQVLLGAGAVDVTEVDAGLAGRIRESHRGRLLWRMCLAAEGGADAPPRQQCSEERSGPIHRCAFSDNALARAASRARPTLA